MINNATFAPPTVPVLLQILSGAKTPQQLLPPGSIYSLPKNSVIEIVIPPGTAPGGPHPFHLHGVSPRRHSEAHLLMYRITTAHLQCCSQCRQQCIQLQEPCSARYGQYRYRRERHGDNPIRCKSSFIHVCLIPHTVPYIDRQPWPMVHPLSHRLPS